MLFIIVYYFFLKMLLSLLDVLSLPDISFTKKGLFQKCRIFYFCRVFNSLHSLVQCMMLLSPQDFHAQYNVDLSFRMFLHCVMYLSPQDHRAPKDVLALYNLSFTSRCSCTVQCVFHLKMFSHCLICLSPQDVLALYNLPFTSGCFCTVWLSQCQSLTSKKKDLFQCLVYNSQV